MTAIRTEDRSILNMPWATEDDWLTWHLTRDQVKLCEKVAAERQEAARTYRHGHGYNPVCEAESKRTHFVGLPAPLVLSKYLGGMKFPAPLNSFRLYGSVGLATKGPIFTVTREPAKREFDLRYRHGENRESPYVLAHFYPGDNRVTLLGWRYGFEIQAGGDKFEDRGPDGRTTCWYLPPTRLHPIEVLRDIVWTLGEDTDGPFYPPGLVPPPPGFGDRL